MFGINLSKIDPFHLEDVWKPLELVSDAAETVRDVGLDIGMGVADMTYGAGKSLVQGDFGEACASVERGFDRALFQSSERFNVGMLYGAQHAVDIAADALGPVGQPIQALADRGFDIAFTALDTSFSVVREEARLIPDMATGLVTDVERAVESATAGHWGQAAGQFAMAGVNLATAPSASMLDVGIVLAQGGASMLQTALFMEPAGRPLTDDEVAYLKEAYGNSIDYGLVRIKPGGWLNTAFDAHTIGNTIYLPKDAFNADGSWAPGKFEYYLAHEVGHIWQNQNAGSDYLHRAFGAQIDASLHGSMMDVYDWRTDLAAGKTFETMDPEAQAEVISDIALALRDGSITTADAGMDGVTFTPAEVAFLISVAGKVGWGIGAG